ncbi:CPBP family intramembrane metalloprotease [Chryseobacterium sp. POL2]|uniref:CPBP family intramembrane glutamic endopeptidase n=1 Tax=Chryseobacterium sp. POL2 TaxID=2713414 RepID=UPI0013E203EF|nr:type II CAAX endopeptidase family protein [Chryseobacterium sp. POL2]QIG88189.1 CPBP family intramembrane metalloprotease [Chryseobacterium sp. POL2]
MKSTILPFNFFAAVILFLGLLTGQMLIALLGVACLYFLHIDYAASPVFMIVGYIVSMAFPVLFYYLFILKPHKLKLQFDFKKNSFLVYLLAFPCMFGMMLMAEYLVTFVPTTGPVFGELYKSFVMQMSSLAMDNVTMILLTVILAPILEEVLFRGVIQKSIVKNGINPRVAILISSFVFGAFHVYPWQFVGAFLLGLVLGLIYEKTQSLLLPILLHAFNNLISALLMMKYGAETSQNILSIDPIYSFMIGAGIFNVFMLALNVYFKRKASIFEG